MDILPIYREICENCKSENTRSYIEYGGTKVTIVCCACGYRKDPNKPTDREVVENLTGESMEDMDSYVLTERIIMPTCKVCGAHIKFVNSGGSFVRVDLKPRRIITAGGFTVDGYDKHNCARSLSEKSIIYKKPEPNHQ